MGKSDSRSFSSRSHQKSSSRRATSARTKEAGVSPQVGSGIKREREGGRERETKEGQAPQSRAWRARILAVVAARRCPSETKYVFSFQSFIHPIGPADARRALFFRSGERASMRCSRARVSPSLGPSRGPGRGGVSVEVRPYAYDDAWLTSSPRRQSRWRVVV